MAADEAVTQAGDGTKVVQAEAGEAAAGAAVSPNSDF